MAHPGKFHEHLNDTVSKVHQPPSIFFRSREKLVPGTDHSKRRMLLTKPRTSEKRDLRQSDTLNCNGLAFRHTKFVPPPDKEIGEFTWRPGARSQPQREKSEVEQSKKAPAALACLASFLAGSCAARKAKRHPSDRRKLMKERKETRALAVDAPPREPAAFVTSPFDDIHERASSSALNVSEGESRADWESDNGSGSSVTMFEARSPTPGRGSDEQQRSWRDSASGLADWKRGLEAVKEEGSDTGESAQRSPMGGRM